MNSFGTVDGQLQGTQCTQADLASAYVFDESMFHPVWTLYPITDSSSTSSSESPLLSDSASSSFSAYESELALIDYAYGSNSADPLSLGVHNVLDPTAASAGVLYDVSPPTFESDTFSFRAPTPEPWNTPESSPAASDFVPLEPLPLYAGSPSPSCTSASAPPDSPQSEWDVDAEGDTDSEYQPDASSEAESNGGDNDDDDDYSPSPSPARRLTRKKGRSSSSRASSASSSSSRRFSPYTPPFSRSRAPSETSSSSTSSTAETAALRYVAARCEQVSVPLESLPQLLEPDNEMICPLCPYVQRSDRRSEYNRHVKTHFRDALHAEHACWGVRVEEAAAYGVTDLSDARMFNGELRVGGCWKGFSRRDAVLRHLKNKHNRCVCDVVPEKVRQSRR